MSLNSILKRAHRIKGGVITPNTFKEYFRLQGGTVVWKKSLYGRGNGMPGTPAGYSAFIKDFNQGVRIQFLQETIKAEVVSFILTHGKYPQGRIVHKDGNRENNHPDNLLELPRLSPARA